MQFFITDKTLPVNVMCVSDYLFWRICTFFRPNWLEYSIGIVENVMIAHTV